MIGSAFFLVASVAAALVYSGTSGEGYSPLNHWVSELGELGVSQLAFVFDLGLVVGGICLAVFMTALGVARGGRLAWIYVPLGIVSGVAGALVGVFPMNQIGVHRDRTTTGRTYLRNKARKSSLRVATTLCPAFGINTNSLIGAEIVLTYSRTGSTGVTLSNAP